MNQHGYPDLLKRLATDPQGQHALQILHERGSLAYLSEADYARLNGDLLCWLLKAESHQGSELVFLTEGGAVRTIPLGSYFDFPAHYAERMPQGAFLSAEQADGTSCILFLETLDREQVLERLELARRNLNLSVQRPLQERILDKLKARGHLSYLSREGLQALTPRLLKYLDYAVNLRPGSELIYLDAEGHVHGKGLESVFQQPERMKALTGPFYLAIEVGSCSVVFDTQDLSPANVWRLRKRAEQLAASQAP